MEVNPLSHNILYAGNYSGLALFSGLSLSSLSDRTSQEVDIQVSTPNRGNMTRIRITQKIRKSSNNIISDIFIAYYPRFDCRCNRLISFGEGFFILPRPFCRKPVILKDLGETIYQLSLWNRPNYLINNLTVLEK